MINNDSDTSKPPVLEEETAASQLTPEPTKPRHRALKGIMATLLALVILLAVIQGYFIFTVKQWQQQQSRQLTMVEQEETAASQQLEKFHQQQQVSKEQQNLTHQ